MKIVHISDTHNKHKKIKIPECDLLIHSGDFSSTGEKNQVKSFLEWFVKQPATHKIFIAGNHDISFDSSKYEDGQKPEWLRELIDDYLKYDGLHFYLEDSGCEIWGLKFWGSPVSPRFGNPRWAFNRERGEDINKHWELIPEDTHVLITHGPPMGVLDWVPNRTTSNGNFLEGGYRGCNDLLNKAEWVQPDLHLFGHIHEGYGVATDHRLGITYSNGSSVDMEYNPINPPNIFEI